VLLPSWKFAEIDRLKMQSWKNRWYEGFSQLGKPFVWWNCPLACHLPITGSKGQWCEHFLNFLTVYLIKPCIQQNDEDVPSVEFTLRVPISEIEALLIRNLNPPANNFGDGPSIASPVLLKKLLKAEGRCKELQIMLKQVQESCFCKGFLGPGASLPVLQTSLLVPPHNVPLSRKTSSPALVGPR
jgi:hypothetical protein